jgi:hypothetical protein
MQVNDRRSIRPKEVPEPENICLATPRDLRRERKTIVSGGGGRIQCLLLRWQIRWWLLGVAVLSQQISACLADVSLESSNNGPIFLLDLPTFPETCAAAENADTT